MELSQNVSLSHTTSSYPTLPYVAIKDKILGSRYWLSLVFVGATRAKNINIKTRNKHYVPDVLSFPLNDQTGEIFICIPKAAEKSSQYGHTVNQHIAFLFIHALLHLKGYDHGDTMEKQEKKYCRLFNLC